MAKIFVINNLGERKLFSWRKIYKSALRVGAAKPLARQIASEIERQAHDNISTKEIFTKVQEYLYHDFPKAGIRFSLKEAMQKLGPSGFPFEKYVSEIFKRLGFLVQINQHLPGKCVFHEIDLLAKKHKQLIIGECKYHSLPGSRVDLRVALSVYARYLDLATGQFFKKKSLKELKTRSMIITNTKFTSEAVRYAECMKTDLLGWRYPADRGLEYVVESNKFYPITILPSLRGDLLNAFSQERIILVGDLLSLDINKFARRTRASESRLLDLRKEAEILMVD